MRLNERLTHQLRPINITRSYTQHAEGSVLVEFGHTKVLCNASLIEGVPRFLKDSKKGWVTAEYGMLPRSTHQRMEREAAKGKQRGRTLEIQRLIARSLRSTVNLEALKGFTIVVDCDVLQADGGTRTASITGGCVALYEVINTFTHTKKLKQSPFKGLIASVSVGICDGVALLDLDYSEDSKAETDMNVVMNEQGAFIEVQGTAENKPFTQPELDQMLKLAKHGIEELITTQKKVLSIA